MRRIALLVLAAALTFPAGVLAQGAAEKRYEIPLENSPSLGPADAPLTVVEFLDFQWPHCQAVGPTVKKILGAYPGQIRLVIKNMPYKYRDYSHLAAEASLAAGDQGKYWEMHDLLLAPGARLDRAGLVQLAAKLGLDVKQFAADLDGMKHQGVIERDKALAVSIDLYETPTFFINGRKVVGNRDFDYLKKIVDEELARAKR